MKYDVFISYRREGGDKYARTIQQALEKQYRVFLDFDELKDGVFDQRIIDAISSSPVFLLILSRGALDRCVNENDWVRQEILYAAKCGSHIVPVTIVDDNFEGLPTSLPEELRRAVGQHQFSELQMKTLFKASMEQLVHDRIAPYVKREDSSNGIEVHIDVDADCDLFRFKTFVRHLKAGEDNVIHLNPGKYKFDFVSTQIAEIKHSMVYSLAPEISCDFIEVELRKEVDEVIAKHKAEEEAKKKAVESKRADEEERRRQDALRRAQEEERRKEEDAKHKAIGIILLQTEALARRKAQEAKRKAEEEARRKALEAKRKAEEEARRKAQEAKRKAEEEARRKAQEAKRKAEEEARRKAQEAKRKAEEEAKRKAQEVAKQKAEAAVIRQTAEDAKLKPIRGRKKLFGIEHGNLLYGYANELGKVVIPFQWKEVEPFYYGLARVVDEKGQWHIINTNGTVLLNIEFSEGLARVSNLHGKWGFIDQKGKMVIPCQWENAWWFSQGLALVKNSQGKNGFIDRTGTLMIPCQWENAWNFSGGLAYVKNEQGLYGFIDKTGKVVIPCRWKRAESFGSFIKGKARVEDANGRTFLIDKTGKW